MRRIARIPPLGRFIDRTPRAKEDTNERFTQWWSDVEARPRRKRGDGALLEAARTYQPGPQTLLGRGVR